MPLYTLKHCLFCYQEDNTDNQDASSVQGMNKKAEMCRRFCTLVSRYLDLDPFHFHPDKTVISKRIYCFDRACDSCLELITSYCEIYHQIKYLQLQLSWRTHEIAEVMKNADDPEGKNIAFRKALEDKLTNMGSNMEEIDDFRTDFIQSIEKRRTESSPTVKVKKEDQEEEDPDFIPVKVTLPIKEKIRNPDDIAEKSNEDTKQKRPSNKRKPVKATTRANSCVSNDSSNTSSTNARNDNRDKTGQEADTVVTRKRPKISIRKDKISHVASSQAATENMSNSHVPLKRDSSSPKSESGFSETTTVITLKDNDYIDSAMVAQSMTKGVLNQSNDNLLHNRDGETSGDDELLVSGDVVKEGSLSTLPKPEPEFEVFLASLKSEEPVNNNNNYFKQFDYLKYSCPLANCGKKFNTMTRMTLHQKATGHNLNAVITIMTRS